MIDDPDIFRAAKPLIDQHGEDAPLLFLNKPAVFASNEKSKRPAAGREYCNVGARGCAAGEPTFHGFTFPSRPPQPVRAYVNPEHCRLLRRDRAKSMTNLLDIQCRSLASALDA